MLFFLTPSNISPFLTLSVSDTFLLYIFLTLSFSVPFHLQQWGWQNCSAAWGLGSSMSALSDWQQYDQARQTKRCFSFLSSSKTQRGTLISPNSNLSEYLVGTLICTYFKSKEAPIGPNGCIFQVVKYPFKVKLSSLTQMYRIIFEWIF